MPYWGGIFQKKFKIFLSLHQSACTRNSILTKKLLNLVPSHIEGDLNALLAGCFSKKLEFYVFSLYRHLNGILAGVY